MKAMCTVVARNYLAHARVLARSFASQHPDVPITVLLLDDDGWTVSDDAEPFDIVRPEHVVAEASLRHMLVMYDVVELATALKPWLLQHLLARHGGAVCYLDPDIEVFSPLDEVAEGAQRSPIVLTPHLTAPMPRDGFTPDEDFILKSGIFNLGFIMVGPGSEPFLEWWCERLRTDCIVAPDRHRFVDQRWVDLASGIFAHDVVRHPGYNVAYWNISTRDLARDDDGGYVVDGEPLRFFHFSGYEAGTGRRLSKHAGALPRHELEATPDVAALANRYGAALRAEGLHEVSAIPYGYASLADGTVLDRRLRRAYRSGLLAHERNGTPLPPNPFQDATAFRNWHSSADLPTDGGWRYTARWSPQFPEELEHLLMAIALRPLVRRVVSRASIWTWRISRKLIDPLEKTGLDG